MFLEANGTIQWSRERRPYFTLMYGYTTLSFLANLEHGHELVDHSADEHYKCYPDERTANEVVHW